VNPRESGAVEPAFWELAKMVEITSTESLLVDLKPAAAILGLSIWTTRGLVRSKTIPAHRIGRKLYMKASDFRASLAGLVASC
jgi:excisionase family DNA binding protein